jgi:hypothetical protein
MFGTRNTGFGRKAPPPPPFDPFPIDKMDRALEAAILLFTTVLDEAGVDCGQLALRGPVPANVGALLADCTTYRREPDGRPTFLALGVTPDFKQFSYPPHCRLYFVLNSVGICEDPHAAGLLGHLAEGQLPDPLVDAWLLRKWVQFILRTNDALRGGDVALKTFVDSLRSGLMEVIDRVPANWRSRFDLKERFLEFAGGFPGTIGHELTPETRRMNGLPVTPFIEDVLIRTLADLQAQGLRDRVA